MKKNWSELGAEEKSWCVLMWGMAIAVIIASIALMIVVIHRCISGY